MPAARRPSRDVVVGLLAVAAFATLLALAWTTFGNRAPPPPPPDPAVAAQRFADAWAAGDVEAIEGVLVRPAGSELAEALAAFDPLGGTALRVAVGEVVEGPGVGRATAVLLPELDLPGVGTWTWQTTLGLERSRASWRVAWEPTSLHPSLDHGLRLELVEEVADRAPILAVDGTPLTATGEAVTVGVEPRAVVDAARLREQLRSLLPEAADALADVLARPDLEPTWFHPLATVPASRIEPVRDRVAALPGLLLRGGEGRVRSGDGDAGFVLGRVVPASQDEAADAGVAPGTGIGRGGLEEHFDEQLRGGPVTRVVAVEPDGDVRSVVATFAEGGTTAVRTTLDAQAVRAVEDALLGRDDNVAVALVGPDGGLLASASRPLVGYHRAFAGAFPPGAAVWPLTLYAAIAEGLVDASSRVACPGEVRVGGVRFDNLGGFDLGEVPLDVAVAEGCRTTIARLGGDLPAGTLAALAQGLGVGTAPPVVLEVAPSQWPPARDTAERAASAVGQGLVLAPVVQLAGIAAAFADGDHHAVHLLPEDGGEATIALEPDAWREARALFAAAGERNGFGAGTGVVSGESTSSEGRLAWAVVLRDDLGGVVMLEQGTRQQALDVARRVLAGLDALRDAG